MSETIDAKVAVLEYIAKQTDKVLNDIRTEIRWFIGLYVIIQIATLGAMAHGFHWL